MTLNVAGWSVVPAAGESSSPLIVSLFMLIFFI